MRPPKISFDRERIGSEEDDHQIKNFESAKRFIIRAASEGARLIIFPEYFITGMIDNHLHLASKEFEWIKKFQTLAIENRIDIIPGTIVEEVVGDGLPLPTPALDQQRSLFNSAYYINKDGEIVAKYRKKNLWHSEKYLTPCPNDHQVFEALDGLRIGLLICWDLAWPEAFRQLMKQKVDLIIIPSYWTLDHPGSKMIKYDRLGSNESKLIDSLILSRALESESCIIFVNCGGKQEDGFLGRSTVCLPLKGDVIKFDRPTERYESIELDLDELKEVLNDAKEVYKVSEEYRSKSFCVD